MSSNGDDKEGESESRPEAFTKPKGPTKRQFESVFQNGIVHSNALFRVLMGDGNGKVGIAVSKKIGSHARRNYQKRRVREILRISDIDSFPNADCVVVIKASAISADFSQMNIELTKGLKELNRRWAERSESI